MKTFISKDFSVFVIRFSLPIKFVVAQYDYEIDLSELGDKVKNFWYSTGINNLTKDSMFCWFRMTKIHKRQTLNWQDKIYIYVFR